ncbi:DUF6304 family protein [Streptomyces rubellomurinus]|uniref:DUF6304 family protein n=1 Tax=Streptomyces rubellomurinus (strain ATCC 31215) TaxID=359131 RepID=UPI000698BCCD|nr:DUF6304 family protein [Streptomyces rubellomurinus]
MIPQSFPGSFTDDQGAEELTWRFVPAATRWGPSYEVRATIRGADVRGSDFDVLKPVDAHAAAAAGLRLDAYGHLETCVLSGDLPCTVERPGDHPLSTIRFTLDLREDASAPSETPLRLSIVIGGKTVETEAEDFENGLLELAAALPDGLRLRSCVTCLLSDYSPAGKGLMGIRCHRGAREQYLAVTRKAEYWPVPLTELVPETYLCGEFEPRVPGTGYRG